MFGDEFGTRDNLGKEKKHNNEIELKTNKDGKVLYAISYLLLPIETRHFRSIANVYTSRSLRKVTECLHPQICISCASNHRRIEHFFLILEIPSADEIHTKDQNMVLPEQIEQKFEGQSFLILTNRSRV